MVAGSDTVTVLFVDTHVSPKIHPKRNPEMRV